MDQYQIKELFQKYLDGTASIVEVEVLFRHIQSGEDKEYLDDLISANLEHPLAKNIADSDKHSKRIDDTHKQLKLLINTKQRTIYPSIYRYVAIAASLILISLIGLYVYKKNSHKPQVYDLMVSAEQILPGSNKAKLTLSDGKSIDLDQTKAGSLNVETGVVIKKTTGGELVYTVKDDPYVSNKFNTIETPNGGQYQISLPDGTKVWLNAASSLKYPLSFGAKAERRVTLSGEAYFEVAKDKAHPFIVSSAGQEVKVLGTHFNINGYKDGGSTITTLEEGSVMVSTGNQKRTIKPGEQTLLSTANGIKVQNASMKGALGWKNNKMVFEDATVPEVMRQVARWYDLQIEYKGKIPDDTFTGTISRQSKLSTVLQMLDAIQIHFSIEENANGKKLIVRP